MRLAGVQAVQAEYARNTALAQAFELYEAKRYAEARAAFEEILKALPVDVDALNGLGNTLESLEQDEEALVAYVCAIAAQPELAMLRRNRAGVLLRLGRYDEAEQDVAVAARLEPDHPFTRARQGYLALARGQFTEAQAHFAAAVAAQPEDSGAWPLMLALALLGQGQADEAEAAFVAALAKANASDREEAMLWLERLVAQRPDLAVATQPLRAALDRGLLATSSRQQPGAKSLRDSLGDGAACARGFVCCVGSEPAARF